MKITKEQMQGFIDIMGDEDEGDITYPLLKCSSFEEISDPDFRKFKQAFNKANGDLLDFLEKKAEEFDLEFCF